MSRAPAPLPIVLPGMTAAEKNVVYVRRHYLRNRERILRERAERYRNDPAFRERQLKYSAERRKRSTTHAPHA